MGFCGIVWEVRGVYVIFGGEGMGGQWECVVARKSNGR